MFSLMKLKHLSVGTTLNNLTIISHIGFEKGCNYYLCKCICGAEIKLSRSRFANQKTFHSGCSLKENYKHHNLVYEPREASYRNKAIMYKATAKSRKHSFELSIEETIVLLKGNCFYCNEPPSQIHSAIVSRKNKSQYNFYKKEEYTILYNGIDRIDSKKGYSLSNVVPCCKSCNTAKLDRTKEEFEKWIVKVYNNLIKQR